MRRVVGLFLLVAGGLLALTFTALQAYSYYASWQMSRLVVAPASTLSVEGTATAESNEPAPQPAVGAVTTAASASKAPSPPTRLRIPSIDLDAKVVEVGTRVEKGQLVWEVPAFAVGHYRTTALPGQDSNVVMSGHISSPFEGSVFRRLPDVRVGDMIFVETERAEFHYQVVSRDIVTPETVQVMQPTPKETLTLITCYPDLVFSHRLVVRALPMGQASGKTATPRMGRFPSPF